MFIFGIVTWMLLFLFLRTKELKYLPHIHSAYNGDQSRITLIDTVFSFGKMGAGK